MTHSSLRRISWTMCLFCALSLPGTVNAQWGGVKPAHTIDNDGVHQLAWDVAGADNEVSTARPVESDSSADECSFRKSGNCPCERFPFFWSLLPAWYFRLP